MAATENPVVRDARPEDVVGICRFGEAHVEPHYAPLIGAEAAAAQVTRWWNEEQIAAAVSGGLVVVAVVGERIVGVGQRGRRGEDHVIYKLYVDPALRGGGIGPRLIGALVAHVGAAEFYVEHFAANERAGAFYEREGFEVRRVEDGVVWRSLTRP
ncbi:GNAT family N-acetyltransferase [Lentzea sp. CA-135723]|uniref:GNAT family N-acetyltransferase n=1 Tax=Lentzea sp. CA-135723 TaxID=3239950 RepID=UPI003D8BFA01